MSLMWPGPGRALQFHLDLFADVDRTHTWMNNNVGRRIRVDSAPMTFRQRAALMSSMTMLGPQIIIDGHTVALDKDPGDVISEHDMVRTTSLIMNERKTLDAAETHYVSHHISASLVDAAKAGFDEPLYITDVPAESGLIVFEYPITIPDLHPDTGAIVPGLDMPIRAISWQVTEVYARADAWEHPIDEMTEMEKHPGISYVLYTDRESYQTLFIPSAERELPEHVAAYRYYDRFHGEPFWAVDVSGWGFGLKWQRDGTLIPRHDHDQGYIHDTVAYIRRWLLAYFRWTWQRILVPQTYKPSRPEIRRMTRAGMVPEDGHMKIIRLRREVEAEARGEKTDSVEWRRSHQWIVKAHPRRQWYPSLGPARNEDGSWNHDSHRMIWVEAHIAGNPDGPLIVGHNIVAAVR
jgi:hypothetical protein